MMSYLDNNQQPSENPLKTIKIDKDYQPSKMTVDYSSDDS